jgi:hypothetical protein
VATLLPVPVEPAAVESGDMLIDVNDQYHLVPDKERQERRCHFIPGKE